MSSMKAMIFISTAMARFKSRLMEDPTLFARMVIRSGRHYFDIKESDGRWHSYPVDYTIGSKWQQAYATKLPNGQIHVLPIQYSAVEKKWLNYWKVIDAAGSERDTRQEAIGNLRRARSRRARRRKSPTWSRP